MQNDINGAAWCLADCFTDIGIEYLTMGQHGHRALVPFDTATSFWWQSPAGNRVLAFRADHYQTGNFWGIHTGKIEPVEDELLRYVKAVCRGREECEESLLWDIVISGERLQEDSSVTCLPRLRRL